MSVTLTALTRPAPLHEKRWMVQVSPLSLQFTSLTDARVPLGPTPLSFLLFLELDGRWQHHATGVLFPSEKKRKKLLKLFSPHAGDGSHVQAAITSGFSLSLEVIPGGLDLPPLRALRTECRQLRYESLREAYLAARGSVPSSDPHSGFTFVADWVGKYPLPACQALPMAVRETKIDTALVTLIAEISSSVGRQAALQLLAALIPYAPDKIYSPSTPSQQSVRRVDTALLPWLHRAGDCEDMALLMLAVDRAMGPDALLGRGEFSFGEMLAYPGTGHAFTFYPTSGTACDGVHPRGGASLSAPVTSRLRNLLGGKGLLGRSIIRVALPPEEDRATFLAASFVSEGGVRFYDCTQDRATTVPPVKLAGGTYPLAIKPLSKVGFDGSAPHWNTTGTPTPTSALALVYVQGGVDSALLRTLNEFAAAEKLTLHSLHLTWNEALEATLFSFQ